MKEIEVGEYVRTKDGLIEKIKTINKFGIVTKHDNKNEDTISGGTNYYTENGLEINTEDIAKHSKNIIDLIEVGDIIEWEYKELGYYGINEVINRFGTIGVYGIEYDNVISLKYITIKRILTHEQYENNSYRIGK